VRGRFFGPADDRVPAGAPVAVLGYEFWRAAVGGDSAVVGRALRVGPAVYTVVGVAPRQFAGVDATPPDVWLPITAAGTEVAGPEYATAYNAVWLQVVGRRRAGATQAQVDADVRAAYGASMRTARDARALAASRPRATFGPVLPDRGPRPGETARVAVWLGGVSLVVLLVACANVASLFLARALGRGREVAVRLALGVGRGRLVAQLLTESVLLATLGAGAGLLVARWGGSVLRATLLPDVPSPAGVAEGRTLAVVLAAAPLTGLLCGLAPALAASRPALTAMLRADARTGAVPRARLREALVVAQVALSVVLLVGAGLFVRSLRNARTLDLGFDAGRAAYVSVDLRGSGVDPSDTTGAYPRQQRALFERLGARVRAVPGVERVGVTTALPFAITIGRRIAVPGVADASSLGFFRYNAVGGDYFAAMGTPILRGRPLDGRDRVGAERAAVVSASAARALWPGREAIGRCLRVGADTAPCRTVVGVAADLRDGNLRDDSGLQYYVATAQGTAAERPPSGLVVRTAGDPAATIGAIRRALQPLVPGAAYVRVRPLREEVDPQFRSWQLGATLFGAFGALALLIAAVGLYGVVSYAAAQRTHELGVRAALGARAAHVVRLAVGEGVRAVGIALALGLAAALAAGRFAAPLLFGVSPRDPVVLGGVAGVLLAVAALAGGVPAWRAARVSPTTALRSE
jgi:predicted permease